MSSPASTDIKKRTKDASDDPEEPTQDASSTTNIKKREKNAQKRQRREDAMDVDENEDDYSSEDDEEIMEEGENEDDSDDEGGTQEKKVFRPGIDQLAEDEELEVDPSAYEMLHPLGTYWPCLSLDVVKDTKGACRTEYPHECLVIAGTQAEKKEDNAIYVMKWYYF